jgi:hypothetical protein
MVLTLGRPKMKNLNNPKENKLCRELRKQNTKLKRELRLLRKQCNRLEPELIDFEEDEEKPAPPVAKKGCPKCGATEYEEFSAGIHSFYKCDSCGSSGRKQTA